MLSGGGADTVQAGAEYHHRVDDGAQALVVFVDDAGLRWLRPLRSGFRHCFIAVHRGNVWIICNSLSHYTDLDVAIGCTTAEIAAWYRRCGFIVVEAKTCTPPKRCAPMRPFTCVETVKRVLGLRAPWVITPWQLYRYLTTAPRCGDEKQEINP